jgi:undecaprenyl-diphosphatase
MKFIQSLDDLILMFIQNNMHNEFLDKIIPIFTALGNGALIWFVIAVILLFYKEYRKYGLIIIASLILCGLIGNIGLKNIVGRLRPCDVNTSIKLLIARPTDFSFPSGHAMTSFTPAVLLMFMNKKIGSVALVLASIIAFSRLYLYVHYPSDVIAGVIIGSSLALVLVKIFIYKHNIQNVYKQ